MANPPSVQRATLSLACLALILSTTSSLPAQAPAVDEVKNLTRIAFGSCNRQDRDPVIFDAIVAGAPQLFLFLGDNIYGDTEDMTEMKAKYDQLLGRSRYQALRNTCPILAIWDDHDYGVNDGGEEYPQRAAAQKLLLEAFEVAPDREPWSRPGTYDAYLFGGDNGPKIQIILLDTRYFRSPLELSTSNRPRYLGPYTESTDPDKTMLGDAQWTWLESQLTEPADIRIIASSIQVLAEDHYWERWVNLRGERDRLLSLVQPTLEDSTVIFLSGDRHLSEIMKMPVEGGTLYEVTSSGITHAGGGQRTEKNRWRIGENFRDRNFGSMEIDPEAQRIFLRVHDIEGQVVREIPVSY